MPSVARRSFIVGDSSAVFTAALIFAITSGARPAGPTTPYQDDTSKPGRPASAGVGTSGADRARCVEVTPMARRRPLP